ncbi:hypothetical protein AAP_04540 [Ascosphaera apis ARSEF 7405]|uniref:Uncharacterized protein n=1 Tax=Ascosphaera apis ARSEF 7405 TaxID=392613 RepID=A0A167WMS2_9EURO|nr:hypothetical protein AAP_04540 [Ascosphaera apis ARSEF 7405]
METRSFLDAPAASGQGHESPHRPRSVSRERQDPYAQTHPPSRIPTPFHAPPASGASGHLPANHPYVRLRRRQSGVWRRNGYNLPSILRECLDAFAARFGSAPIGFSQVSGDTRLSDYIRQECERRAITAFAFLEDVGDTSRWWRRNPDREQHAQFQSAPADLLDDLQWRLLDSDDFTFQRLRSLRHPVLKWKINWWIERFNVQFPDAELQRLREFLDTVHPNGTADTFVGQLPAIDTTFNQDGTASSVANPAITPQRSKKVKIRIGWNYVVRAWIRITDSGADGTQEEELEYFMFPGKLRTVPPRRFAGPWTVENIGFLVNLKQMVEKKPLKVDEEKVHAGLHKAIKERNVQAVEALLTFAIPLTSHFRRAMRLNDLTIFKLLLMYGGQFLPSHDDEFMSWAQRLRDRWPSSRRKRAFGEWLCGYLSGLAARRMALNPLFTDGELHDVDEWRNNERLREVFSDMGITVGESEDDDGQDDHEGDGHRQHRDNSENRATVINSGDSHESHPVSGDTNTTTRGQGDPSDSNDSTRRAHQASANDVTTISTNTNVVPDNSETTTRNTPYIYFSDGPLHTAATHGFNLPSDERRARAVRRRTRARAPPVDGPGETVTETIRQLDVADGYVAVWADGYDDSDDEDWDPDVPSLRVQMSLGW